MVNLGRVLEDKGQYADALVFLKKGLAIREQVLEPGHPDTVSALAWIGVSLCRWAISSCVVAPVTEWMMTRSCALSISG